MEFAKTIIPIRIEDEMRNSYMDYSMSVIIGRALPDVRDGLKPVHRRILYAMRQEGLLASKKYSKCAGVVGEVLKKYHPHGDSAVYDALVRMAQPWNLRYLLVDGQGNFGSVDGDPAAAYRYTECRMTKLAEELLTDIDKQTVSFSPNFDNQVEEPDVLPARFPNLLVNGSEGIAVGMATKIPPHNMTEIINAAVAVIDNPDLGLEDLLGIVPGPDFPTGGTIYGRKGIHDAYETGRGRVIVRGRAEFEEMKNGRKVIVIDELPYQVNKARLIMLIAQLVRDKKLEGISALRDESDRKGMRIVIELKMDAYEEVVLNKLYKHTPLQSTFGVIMLAIVNQRPRVLTLKEMLQHYIAHRREVILRRTRYELRKARERAHILEGYRIALDAIDEVIALIRSSKDAATARIGLQDRFGLSELQASAILEMRLQRLVGLERDKIEAEYTELMERVGYLEGLLASEELLMGVVRTELIEVRDAYGDERRTRIVESAGELSIHDLVPEKDQVVTISHLGYIKRCDPDEWQMQRRGGKGKRGMTTREEDFVTTLFIANTHSMLMVFTQNGKVYPLWVYQVPEAGRTAKGRPIVNLVNLPEGEKLAAVVSIKEIDRDNADLFFVSRKGLVKRTRLQLYRNMNQSGLIAVGVAEGDELLTVRLVEDEVGAASNVMLFSADGKCIRFPYDFLDEEGRQRGVPSIGRPSRGNIGMKLRGEDIVVDAVIAPAVMDGEGEDDEDDDVEDMMSAEFDGPSAIEPDSTEEGEDGKPVFIEEPWETTLLTVTQLGRGKRTPFDQYRRQWRNGSGIMSIKILNEGGAKDTGQVVAALEVTQTDQLMIVTDTGRIIRIGAGTVRLVKSRASRGVRLMRLMEGERIVDVAVIEDADDEETDVVGEEPETDGEADAAEATADAGEVTSDADSSDDDAAPAGHDSE